MTNNKKRGRGRPKKTDPRVKALRFHVSEKEKGKILSLKPKERSVSEWLRDIVFEKLGI